MGDFAVRKLTIIVVMALLAAFSLTPVTAQQPTPNIFAAADLAPATYDVYLGLRLDDAYLATVNDLVSLIADAVKELGAPIENIPRLQDLIALQIDPNSTRAQVDTVLAWIGDTVAISGDISEDGSQTFSLYLSITDQQSALDALNAAGVGLRGVNTAGRYMIYESAIDPVNRILLASDMLIVTNGDAVQLGSGDYAKLSASPDFAALVADLPAESYNVALFVDDSLILQSQQTTQTGSLQGDVLLGATILEGKTLTLDFVMLPPTPAQASTGIDTAFLRHVPSNSSAVIHATDLSNLVNNLVQFGEVRGNTRARAELEQALMAAGLSLDEMLTWTTGDYAVFARVNFPSLFQAFTQSNMEMVATSFDFGIIVEAVDTTLAKQFSDKLTEIITTAIAGQTNTTLSVVNINDTAVTRIESNNDLGAGQSVNFALGMGASDEVFVFGTFRAVESVLTGDDGLSANPLYSESAAYVLPNATSVWYTDGATLVSGVGLLGFGTLTSVSSAFSDIEQEFNFGRQTTARAQTIQTQDEIVFLMRIFDRVTQLVRHATASSAISENGAYVLRATLTLGE
jgi:hypothetical protein